MHLTEAACADAVRGLLAGEEHDTAQAHARECSDCADQLRFWRRVWEMAEADAAFEPPTGAILAAKALAQRRPVAAHGGLSRLADRVRSIVPTLTFDTFEQALPAGVRAGTSGVRQLVYKTSEMSVDLRLEATGRGGRIVIAGQVGAPFDDGAAGARPTISVLQRSTELVTTTANEFGEFQCEFVAGDDLMLSIALADGSNFTISLDRLPIE